MSLEKSSPLFVPLDFGALLCQSGHGSNFIKILNYFDEVAILPVALDWSNTSSIFIEYPYVLSSSGYGNVKTFELMGKNIMFFVRKTSNSLGIVTQNRRNNSPL